MRVAAALGLGCAALGCARYTPAPLDPAGTADAYAARRLDAPDLRDWLAAHGATDSAWTSATLGLVALYYGPAVATARAAWESARAAEGTAGARPQPAAEGEVGHTISGAEPGSPWIGRILSIFTVELGGKRGARIAAARARAAVAETDLEETAWRATRAVRAAAVGLAAAGERLADASQGADRVAAFTARLRRLFDEGTLGRSELAAVESEQADARAAADRERAGEDAARVALSRAAGLPPAALDGVRMGPEPAPVCVTAGTDSLQALALRRRPDVGRALAEYGVAEGELRVAVAASYPDLGFGAGLDWDRGETRWVLSPVLPRIPLNGNRGPIAEALARRREAAARFAERQQGVLAEVSGAVAGCRAALADVEGADSVRAATARQAELARAAYERGEIGAVALEPLELAETRARRDLHAARQRVATAALALETATGEWPPGSVRWPDPREPVKSEEGSR